MISILLRYSIFYSLLFLPVLAQSQLFEYKSNQKWGLINAQGEIVLAATYDYIEVPPPRTYFYLHKEDKMGVYHFSQGMLIEPLYDHIFPFQNGYFMIADKGKYGIIDSIGTIVTLPEYERFQQASGFFFTHKNDQMGLFDPAVGELLPTKFDTIYPFDNTYLAVIENGKLGLVSNKGVQIEAPVYAEIALFDKNKNLYILRKNGLIGLKHLGEEEFVLPIKYEHIKTFMQKEPLLQAYGEGQGALFNFKGEQISGPISGQFVAYFDELYVYKQGRGTGLMDINGNILTEAIFSKMKPYNEKYILVNRNKLNGLISREGKLILPSSYSHIYIDEDGWIWAKQKKLWALYGEDGKQIFPPTFIKPAKFKDNIAVVGTPIRDANINDGRPTLRYGLLHQSGEYLIEPKYERIRAYGGKAYLKMPDANEAELITFTQDGQIQQGKKVIVSLDEWKATERDAKDAEELANIDWDYDPSATARSVRDATKPETLEWVQANGLWGLKSTDETSDYERWKIPPTYHTITPTANKDLVLVSQENNGQKAYGLVSISYGRNITSVTYKNIFVEDLNKSNFVRAIDRNGSYDILTSKGKSAIAQGPKYTAFWGRYASFGIKQGPTYVGKIDKGWARVCFNGKPLNEVALNSSKKEQLLQEGGGIWGIMKPNGVFELDPIYGYIGEIQDGVFTFEYKSKWGLMDTSLLTILEPTYTHIQDPGEASAMLIHEQEANKISILKNEGIVVSNIVTDERNEAYKNGIVEELGMISEGFLGFKQKGKWGFMDIDGNIVIAPVYGNVGEFSEGMARVKIGRYWGFIDTTGTTIIEPEFLRAEDFECGMAAVGNGREWNFIEKSGKKAMKQTFSRIGTFMGGKAIVKDEKANLWGVVDTLGNWILDPVYDEITYHEGFYRVRQKRYYGYFNEILEEILPVENTFLGPISEKKMAISANRLYGFADISGKTIIEPQFEAVEAFQGNMAAIQKNGHWGFIDGTGSVVVQAIYTKVNPFKGDRAAVGKKGINSTEISWGFIDKEGNEIVPLIYKEVMQSTDGVLMCKNTRGEWYYFDAYGIPISNDTFKNAEAYKHSLSKATINSKRYLLATNGKRITNPGYDDILDWNDIHILSTNTKRKGLISRAGKEILAPTYDQIHFYDGLYQIVNDGKVGYMDEKGTWVWPLGE